MCLDRNGPFLSKTHLRSGIPNLSFSGSVPVHVYILNFIDALEARRTLFFHLTLAELLSQLMNLILLHDWLFHSMLVHVIRIQLLQFMVVLFIANSWAMHIALCIIDPNLYFYIRFGSSHDIVASTFVLPRSKYHLLTKSLSIVSQSIPEFGKSKNTFAQHHCHPAWILKTVIELGT